MRTKETFSQNVGDFRKSVEPLLEALFSRRPEPSPYAGFTAIVASRLFKRGMFNEAYKGGL